MKTVLTQKSNNVHNGYVATKPLSPESISQGTKAVLVMRTGMMVVCTVLHYTAHGEWVVLYGGNSYTLAEGDELCSLIVKRQAGDNRFLEHPLRHGDWKSAIGQRLIADQKPIVFQLVPLKFKPGVYGNICTQCNAYFSGGASQTVCEPCCDEHAEAKLRTNTVPKEKKPRMLSASEARSRAEQAWNIAMTGAEDFKDFNDWYDSNF